MAEQPNSMRLLGFISDNLKTLEKDAEFASENARDRDERKNHEATHDTIRNIQRMVKKVIQELAAARLTKIETPMGVIYIEKRGDREENDRIKIYDSELRYLEYMTYDDETSYKNDIFDHVSKCQTIDEILDLLGIHSRTISEDWQNLLEDLYGFDGYYFAGNAPCLKEDDSLIYEEKLMENEYINRIGKFYILQSDH